jgi:hypothetical protein
VERQILNDIFLFVTAITTIGCLTGIIVTFLKRRSSKAVANPDLTVRLDDIADRLNRLEGAVDTVAVEVERISEAQRFTAKVLAERSGNPGIADRSRSGPITPH